jgi:hypothetical protein
LKQKDILEFWRDVEVFDLPDLHSEAKLLQEGDELPWFRSDRLEKKNYKWRYTLIFGKIDKKVVVDHLNGLLKVEDANDWEEPVKGFSCLSALILDENGNPEYDSYLTASYILGLRALEKKINLSTVAVALEKAQEDFLERYNFGSVDAEGEEMPKGDIVTWQYLAKEITYLKKLSLWWKEDIKVFIVEEHVPKDSEQNTSFLNSFYLEDLNYLNTLKEKELGIALQSYLSINPSLEKRKDIIQNKAMLFQSINPGQMPAGRWLSDVKYGLYSAQVGAVNTIFSNLIGQEGLQGVNGPPGTGKTTLLLDVVANIVVDRAKVLSSLGCDDIFEKGYFKIEKESGYDRYTYNLNKGLKNNFGIVVASNNNAAVENISKELPMRRKIDNVAFPEAGYFSKCSQGLINEESWGILAAALGNAKNRNAFRKAFWLSQDKAEQMGFNDLLYSIYLDPENDTTATYRESFKNRNKIFKDLLKEFDEFRQVASSFHNQLSQYIKNKQKEEEVTKELNSIENKLSTLYITKNDIQERENFTTQDASRLQSLLTLHLQRKPSFFFFHKLFSTSRYKKWNAESEELLNKLKPVSERLENIRKEQIGNRDEIKGLISKQEKYKKELADITLFFVAYKKLRDILIQKYEIEEKNLCDIDFLRKDLHDIQLLNPYHSSKIAKLRGNIFNTSLQLHRDAILANAKNIRNNLTAFFEMTGGWARLNPDIAQNLWDTLFLCVPVVSTTLASVSRLFPNTEKKQIGWLLIDEAGQATPQSVAGIIHRSKRCVIVGDPLQVEPVVTMPEKLVTKLRNEHDVTVGWSPYKVSVQQLADRVSESGTYMRVGGSDEKIWTGFPLRTHRRCDDPMFTIANQIAYSNQMVKAINENSTDKFIGASTWFHVENSSVPYNKHVILEEIEVLKAKISELLQTGYKDEIYVISPFKSIANFCEQEFRSQKKISCGTIHKFQGKEADIVFLVLGSDPKSQGARNWASQKPNMLNVALTRAKKRFYVIGNRKFWASCDYFREMANMLK